MFAAALAGAVEAANWVAGAFDSTPATAPPPDPHGAPIAVAIPTGTDAGGIASILGERGIVADSGRFQGYVNAQGEGTAFKAGTYSFRAGTGYDAIIHALDAGPDAGAKTLVIPEGFRLTEIESRLPSVGIDPKAYATAVRRAAPPAGFGHHLNMEGFLFPATYQIRPHESAADLVAQQLAAFRDNFAQVDMSYARSKNLTPYDVLTIASMIEREARVPGDRAKVSAVIYNRLHRHMDLGIDATILYHLGSWTATIHQSDLDAIEPYNTRKVLGLPPTPICNPGLASLQAAAHPAHADYLYYVAIPGKAAQYFTASYQDFRAHGG